MKIKKRILTVLAIYAVLFAGYNVYKSQNIRLSLDISLANAEALAFGEFDELDCTSYLGVYQGASSSSGNTYIHKYRCGGTGTECHARDEIHSYYQGKLSITVQNVAGICR